MAEGVPAAEVAGDGEAGEAWSKVYIHKAREWAENISQRGREATRLIDMSATGAMNCLDGLCDVFIQSRG
jgi:hypothetical protein